LYFFYPLYLFGRVVATRIQPRIHDWLMRRRIIRWLRGAEAGAQWGFGG
jgi:hypothetical protein